MSKKKKKSVDPLLPRIIYSCRNEMQGEKKERGPRDFPTIYYHLYEHNFCVLIIKETFRLRKFVRAEYAAQNVIYSVMLRIT